MNEDMPFEMDVEEQMYGFEEKEFHTEASQIFQATQFPLGDQIKCK